MTRTRDRTDPTRAMNYEPAAMRTRNDANPLNGSNTGS